MRGNGSTLTVFHRYQFPVSRRLYVLKPLIDTSHSIVPLRPLREGDIILVFNRAIRLIIKVIILINVAPLSHVSSAFQIREPRFVNVRIVKVNFLSFLSLHILQVLDLWLSMLFDYLLKIHISFRDIFLLWLINVMVQRIHVRCIICN